MPQFQFVTEALLDPLGPTGHPGGALRGGGGSGRGSAHVTAALQLPRGPGAFATIQVDVVPTASGMLQTPMLRIFPPSQKPVDSGKSLLTVSQ